MTLDRANASLHAYYPAARVWQEQLQQKVNVDRNGIILKGYDVVAYFTQHKAIKGRPSIRRRIKGRNITSVRLAISPFLSKIPPNMSHNMAATARTT
jgi:hypothetical protein